jgi:hypothetical protein
MIGWFRSISKLLYIIDRTWAILPIRIVAVLTGKFNSNEQLGDDHLIVMNSWAMIDNMGVQLFF